jgi:hypothetical protein
MYSPEPVSFKEQWQRFKPLQVIFIILLIMLKLMKCVIMLGDILDQVLSEVTARGGLKMETKGVILVITHQRDCLVVFDHGTNNSQRPAYFRAAINVVAQEQDLSFGVPVGVVSFAVAQKPQQCLQLFGMSMNVTHDIVHNLQFFMKQLLREGTALKDNFHLYRQDHPKSA